MKLVWPHDPRRHGGALAQDRAGTRRRREGRAGADRGAQTRRRPSCARRASAPTRSSIRRSTAPTSWSRRPRARRSSEGARIVAAAQQQIELDTTRARESLRREVAGIAVRRRRQAARARDRRARPRGSARQARRRRSERTAHGRPAHHRPTLRARRLRRGARRRAARRLVARALRTAAPVVKDPRVAALLGNPHVTPGGARAARRSPSPGRGARRARRELRAHARRQPPPCLPAGDRRRCSTSSRTRPRASPMSR